MIKLVLVICLFCSGPIYAYQSAFQGVYEPFTGITDLMFTAYSPEVENLLRVQYVDNSLKIQFKVYYLAPDHFDVQLVLSKNRLSKDVKKKIELQMKLFFQKMILWNKSLPLEKLKIKQYTSNTWLYEDTLGLTPYKSVQLKREKNLINQTTRMAVGTVKLKMSLKRIKAKKLISHIEGQEYLGAQIVRYETAISYEEIQKRLLPNGFIVQRVQEVKDYKGNERKIFKEFSENWKFSNFFINQEHSARWFTKFQ